MRKRHHEDQIDGNQKDDVGSEVPTRKSKRQFTFPSVVRQVMRELSLEEFGMTLEPLFRRVVREEVEHALPSYQPSPSSSTNEFELLQVRSWQLHIEDKLPSKLFTGNRIESENGTPIKIVIREAISKNIMTSGLLSSLEVEILVLDGDFGADDQNNWTEKDFNAKIVCAREGKRPLLVGTLIISLRNGVGYITNIFFTDNSSWRRSGKFRLGVRSARSIPTEARIREAISDAFVVKDHRGEVYKKHYPPNLGDEVWRLEKIAKDGVFHKRLADKGITMVQDLLQLYNVEPMSLRNALGGKISSKRWKTIIEHANTCTLDDEFFVYYGRPFGIVFNSIFKVVAVTFDGLNTVPLNELGMVQMGLVNVLKKNAYENKNDLLLLDQLSPLGSNVLQLSLPLEPPSSSHVQNVNSAGVQKAGDAAQFQSYDLATYNPL